MITTNKNFNESIYKLADKALNDGYQLEAIHEYTDQIGQALYWRIRLKHPTTGVKWIRPVYLKANKYCLGEPKNLERKPLYRLHEIISRPDEIVMVCEGEWCADNLAKLGVLVTTSGAANSAEKADWQLLTGRTVIIWPDHDKAGQQYANTVASILKLLKCKVQIIDVSALNLPEKGDAVNWLEDNPSATKETVFNLPTLDYIAPVLVDTLNQQNLDDSEDRQSQATMLVDFVDEHAELFHDQNANVYAQDRTTGEIRRLDSMQFRDWLLASFYDLTNKALRDQSMREALSTLSGLARFKGKCHEVFIRVAQHENAYYLDLAESGNSRAVKIAAGSWEIINQPPVRFLRPETLRALPEPFSGGNLSELWALVNVPENAQLLCIAWLIECLRPDTPFPLLELIGEQGSAKSTTQEILRRLIDPNACNLRGAAKNTEDVFISAISNWFVSYENISHLSPAMQDALCILSTGGGFAKRKLYSDIDESVIVVKRPIILNGISAAVTAQDLIDRTLSIEMPIIMARTETTALWHKFETLHGRLLGALFDIMADALARLPSIQIPTKNCPRLIEFARLGMAVAEAMGKSGEDFLSEFNASRQESIARTIDASPVASALIEWFDSCERRTNKLPLNQLFQLVEKYRPPNTDAWPRSAKGFADALRRAAPALRQLGIECRSLGKTGSYVSWLVKKSE